MSFVAYLAASAISRHFMDPAFVSQLVVRF